MIDQDVFKLEWRVLIERFGKRHSDALMARYYQSLSPRLSTDQFRAAARALFERARFFPSPDEFLDACLGTAEERAMDDWTLCERVMTGSDPGALERMSPAGRKTVSLMGGSTTLRNTLLADLPFRRAEFLRLHRHALETWERENRHAALPPAPDRQVLERYVPNLLGEGAAATDDP